MGCAKEQTTQHHLGAAHGHGCIRPMEDLVIAVFDSTPLEAGGTRLSPLAFPTKQLSHGEVSLARSLHTSRKDFENHVLSPRRDAGSRVHGVSVASAHMLRSLPATLPGANPPMRMRAVCVLDKVVPGDHDGHAALQYSEEQNDITAKQKARLRSLIAADLANVFSPVCSIDDAPFIEPLA